MPKTVLGDEDKARNKTHGADFEAVLLCFLSGGFLEYATYNTFSETSTLPDGHVCFFVCLVGFFLMPQFI